MLLPVFAMVVLTLIVGAIAFQARVQSVKQGTLTMAYFKSMSGESVPNRVLITTRNLNNQFEIPMLFYVVCLAYLALGIESASGAVIAWLFVFFRAAHAYVHLTYNRVTHRMLAFWLALMCVVALWLVLIVAVYF